MDKKLSTYTQAICEAYKDKEPIKAFGFNGFTDKMLTDLCEKMNIEKSEAVSVYDSSYSLSREKILSYNKTMESIKKRLRESAEKLMCQFLWETVEGEQNSLIGLA